MLKWGTSGKKVERKRDLVLAALVTDMSSVREEADLRVNPCSLDPDQLLDVDSNFSAIKARFTSVKKNIVTSQYTMYAQTVVTRTEQRKMYGSHDDPVNKILGRMKKEHIDPGTLKYPWDYEEVESPDNEKHKKRRTCT